MSHHKYDQRARRARYHKERDHADSVRSLCSELSAVLSARKNVRGGGRGGHPGSGFPPDVTSYKFLSPAAAIRGRAADPATLGLSD